MNDTDDQTNLRNVVEAKKSQQKHEEDEIYF